MQGAEHLDLVRYCANALDKMGFPVPMRKWFSDTLYKPMQDLLGSQEVRERSIYNMATIRRDLELHRQGKVDVSGKLFNLAQFEIWSKLGQTHTTRSNTVGGVS